MEYLSRVMDYAVGKWFFRVNATKSEVVFNGVTECLKQDITYISVFQEGNLPFKYLGVPIQAGRLTKYDFNILVDKIVAKIRGIWVRKLSYAGRINGADEYQRTPLVAWDNVCCSKKEGGLGIKNAGVWNIATVGKLVIWIYTKVDRLWVLWFDHIYMKGADWNSYIPPPDSNWVTNGWLMLEVTLLVLDTNGYRILHPPVHWYKDVWDNWNIPKQSVIGWLIQRKALNTRAKLFQLGISDTNRCMSLNAVHGHCPKVRRKVWRVARLSCCYVLWTERNKCRVDMKIRWPALLVLEIQSLLQDRIRQKLLPPVQQADKDCHEPPWLEPYALFGKTFQVTRVVNAKYYPNGELMSASLGINPSYT
ncbi:uncharacterized protein LOC141601055 [Silene latifolia]|uniref:uncharacterized protein LOC141601055 n=1 Tax=Silene latifolia TaxID=37657 RepID=UPI003D77984F